jgi:hypothetical protein
MRIFFGDPNTLDFGHYNFLLHNTSQNGTLKNVTPDVG